MTQIACNLWMDTSMDGSFGDEFGQDLISAQGQMRIAAPGDTIASPKGIVSQASFTLTNNKQNLGLTDYQYYQMGLYFEVSTTGPAGTYYRLFTGSIENPAEQGPTAKSVGQISFDARGRENEILQKRTSTNGATFKNFHDVGKTESEIMAQWLSDAGLSSGEYSLDSGLFVIPWAWLDDESPLEDIWSLAAACGGWFYSDPSGILRYENMAHWIFNTSSVATYTPDNYQRFSAKYDTGDLYQTVTVEVSTREIQAEDTVWTSSDIVIVPASGTKVVTAALQQPLYELSTIGYSAQTAGGKTMDSAITVTTVVKAQRVLLTFTNSDTSRAALITGLKITGKAVHGGPSEEVSKSSANSYWTARQGRTRSIRRNNYVQSGAQADALATFLRDRHEIPRRIFTITGALGNPALRLGNLITVNSEPMLASVSTQMFITAINWQYSRQGFLQTIECIEAAGIYPLFNADPGYFRVGVNYLGVGVHPKGRLFY